MGMNMADIREMDLQTDVFWAIAIPFTSCVVGLALLYGYKWDMVMEYLSQLHTSSLPSPRAAATAAIPVTHPPYHFGGSATALPLHIGSARDPRRFGFGLGWSWPAAATTEGLGVRLRRRMSRS